MNSHKSKFYEVKLTEDALLNKISFFADKEGYVDAQSIRDAYVNKLHLSEAKSTTIAINTLWNALYQGIPGITYSFFSGIYGRFKPKDAVPLFTLAYDGGLYDKKGTFRDDLFKILEEKYAVEDWDNEKIISKTKMKEFLEKETQQTTARSQNATWAYHNLAIPNQDEFDAIFDSMATRRKRNSKTGEIHDFATLHHLKLWYVNSKYLTEQLKM